MRRHGVRPEVSAEGPPLVGGTQRAFLSSHWEPEHDKSSSKAVEAGAFERRRKSSFREDKSRVATWVLDYCDAA
jgi:hypothetical protein